MAAGDRARQETRVALALRDRLLRAGLRSAVEEAPDLCCVADADDLAALPACLVADRTADVLVVGLDVARAAADLRDVVDVWHPARLLLLSAEHEPEALLLAVDGGAAGFVTGRQGLAALLAAVRDVAAGRSCVPPDMLGGLLEELVDRNRQARHAADRWHGLSAREREVLGLLAAGQSTTEVAAALVISPQTARSHVGRVLRKLEVHSQAEAVDLALRLGLSPAAGRGRTA